MKNLAIKTQKKTGNEPKYQENLAFVTTFINHSEDYIVVDNFEGQGDSYKQRELSEISIFENGVLIFSGSKYELFEQLKK